MSQNLAASLIRLFGLYLMVEACIRLLTVAVQIMRDVVRRSMGELDPGDLLFVILPILVPLIVGALLLKKSRALASVVVPEDLP